MHRLRSLYALCFGRSIVIASSAQSTANFGFGRATACWPGPVRKPTCSSAVAIALNALSACCAPASISSHSAKVNLYG